MPFWVVSRVGRGMGVLDGAQIVEGEGAVLRVNVGHPTVTIGTLWRRDSSQITLRFLQSVTMQITDAGTCVYMSVSNLHIC